MTYSMKRRSRITFCKVAILGALIGASMAAEADPLAAGTVTQIAAGNGYIAVQLTAVTGSACPTGYFYAYDSDASATAVNRWLSVLLSAQARGAVVYLYGNVPIVCASSHFMAITSK